VYNRIAAMNKYYQALTEQERVAQKYSP